MTMDLFQNEKLFRAVIDNCSCKYVSRDRELLFALNVFLNACYLKCCKAAIEYNFANQTKHPRGSNTSQNAGYVRSIQCIISLD